MKKTILYIDTTTDWIVLGLYFIENHKLERLHFEKGSYPRESSFRLVKDLKQIFDALGLRKTNYISVVYGPGSFTGIRIAVATARNLSQFWEVPVFGIDTLEVYSSYYYDKFNKASLVLLDGKMKKVFAGAYSEIGFSGSLDISPLDVERHFDLSQYVVYSDIQIFNSHSISNDYPEPDYILNKKIYEIQNMDLNFHNYKNLLPNYKRGTYAERETRKKI